MKRPAGWTWLWLAWLGFLLLDFVAAIKERSGGVRTLSRHVWAWFPWGWRRSVLAAFLGALGAHLVFEAPAWWLLTAVPLVAVIVDSVWWAGDMSLLDKAVRALALRWGKGKVDAARKGGSNAMKLLDGNKRLVVTLGFIVASLVAMITGHDVSQWLDFVLRATGWTNAEMIEAAKGLSTQIVPLLFALWAAGSALVKMYQQHKAGATASEISSPTGVLKAAIADGTLRSDVPVVLSIVEAKPAAAALPVEMVVFPVEPAETREPTRAGR